MSGKLVEEKAEEESKKAILLFFFYNFTFGVVANVRRGGYVTAEAKVMMLLMKPLVGWWCGLEYCFCLFFFLFFLILFGTFFY